MINFLLRNRKVGLEKIFLNLNNLIIITDDIKLILESMGYYKTLPDKNKLKNINSRISTILDSIYNEKLDSSFNFIKLNSMDINKIKVVLDDISDIFCYDVGIEEQLKDSYDDISISKDFLDNINNDLNCYEKLIENYKDIIRKEIENTTNKMYK